MSRDNQWRFDPSTPENTAKLAAWNERVTREISLRTRPIDQNEEQQITAALHGMYEAAKLPHDNLRIVIVPSPFMAHVVASFAYSWWNTTRAATYAATLDATDAATRDATDAATYAATDAATLAATYAATRDATYAATDGATYAATDGLVAQIKTMMDAAHKVTRVRADNVWNIRSAGAEWYHWYSFLAFVRDEIGWSHKSHKNFAFSEVVQRLGGVRYMHREFVIVADHPRTRNVVWVNGVATIHCETGPAVEWSDGCAIYAIDGVVLPHNGIGRRIVEDPDSLTIAEIGAIDNADARSIAIRRFGWHRYVREIHADCIDYRRNDIEGTREALFRTPTDGHILVAVCPTGRVFGMRVPPTTKTCSEAQAYLAGPRSGRSIGRT